MKNPKDVTNYRPDIDGLRAVAILLVVFFHAFPTTVTGGFIGVDIFFVISGYLISGIIFSGLNRGNFSFIDFYSRRIRRIFPSLLVVLITCYALGWTIFADDDDYKYFAKHVAGGAAFVSNFVLMSENGYFDSQSDSKPLMHLWSLAIEEQFYILWPLLLFIAYQKSKNFLYIISGIGIISFITSIILIYHAPIAAFYRPEPRFWELLIGAGLAYINLYKPEIAARIGHHSFLPNVLSFFGILFLTAAIFLITPDALFPGWWALLPTIGAALIIFAGPDAWLNKQLLSHPLAVWIGLISYPLYLWHWPLLSFARIIEHETPTVSMRWMLIIFSVILAWSTYKFIDIPIRFGPMDNKKLAFLCGVMLMTGGFAYLHESGITGINSGIYDAYYSNTMGYYKKYLMTEWWEECNFFDNLKTEAKTSINQRCYTVKHPGPKIFIWGDSYAEQLYPGLSHFLPPAISILQIATAQCQPSLTPVRHNFFGVCNNSNKLALEKIKETRPDIVILAQRKNHQSTDFEELARHLKTIGVKNVILLGPVPEWKDPLYKIVIHQFDSNPPQRINGYITEDVLKTDRLLKEKYTHSHDLIYISLIDFLCNKQGCIAYFGNNKLEGLETFDDEHLTPIASDQLARQVLVPVIIKLIRNPEAAFDNPGK